MASEAQVVANRCNAQKSTGPRTPEGKAVVSQNADKHGLLARQAVIVGEDPGEYEFYRDQMVEELAPAGLVESMLAERVVSLSWRLRRAERLQNEAFDALYIKETTGLAARFTRSLHPKSAEGGPGDGDSALGRVVLHGFSNDRVLERLMMYERRIEQSLYKTMAELQRPRLLRELDPPMEKPPVSPAPPNADDLLRQTKPIPAGRDVEPPAGREAMPDSAKQTQFAETVGREPGANCANQGQSVEVHTDCRPEKGVCEPMRIVQNTADLQGHSGILAGCAEEGRRRFA